MKKENIQYIFIYLVIILITLAIIGAVAYCVYAQITWMHYSKDDNLKGYVQKIEELQNKKDKTAMDYIDIGNNYYALRYYDKSISYYQKALSLDNNNYVIYRNIGVSLRDKGDYKNAEVWFLKALEKNNSQSSLYLEIADIYKYFPQDYYKYTQEGILLEGLKVLPNDFNLTLALARYYGDIKDINKATEYYNKAITLKPDATDIKDELQKLTQP